MDNPIYEEEMLPVQKHVTTYEDLRKKNREEYQQKRLGNYRDPPRTASPSQPSKESPDSENSYEPSPPKSKYGDIWG
ncbi:hypothetical protein NQ317_009639 [Molorchus minor]|uniref:Uncharacterized protein n=1 Tax=Molorchus minor TaxID=1323400 RepID=A0ABQ9JWE8_9CUCU|nr:hypothetical protein NQ317_009639 [Molorchus minor]